MVVLAQDEARRLSHNYIGTEHLLLGLLRVEEGLAARVLASLEITLERVRVEVARIVGEGDAATSGQLPFTPRAKKVLELSLREALALGHNYIGTEHVLLGLAREGDGVAARILRDLGADGEQLRSGVMILLPESDRRGRRVGGKAEFGPPRRGFEYHLEPWPPPKGSDRTELLNRLGGEEWRLVGVAGGELIFERPARRQPSPPEPPTD